MSNNMKALNSNIFDKIWSKIPEEYAGEVFRNKVRFINTLPEEKERLKKARISCDEILIPGVRALVIKLDNEYFIAITNYRNTSAFGLNGVAEVETTCAGLSTFVLSNNWPLLEVDGYLIADVFAERQGGFDICEVTKYFEPFSIIKVDKSIVAYDQDGSCSTVRLFTMQLLSSRVSGMMMSEITYVNLQLLVENTVGWVFSGQILRTLTAMHYQHMFLDIYRCIERMFYLPYCIEIQSKLIEGGVVDASSLIIENMETLILNGLGWKPKEALAIDKIFRYCSENTINTFVTILSIANNENKVSSVASKIYAIRNSIAHYRKSGSKDVFVGSWSELIECMTIALRDIFLELKPHLVVEYGIG